MSTLEDIKQKKILELQQRMQQQQTQEQQEQSQIAQQIEQLEMLARHSLTKEALSRYGNIKTAHPELAIKSLVAIAQFVQAGHNIIDDEQFKLILQKLNQKQDIKITRK